MSRLAAMAKAEYYPTPPEVVDLIAPYITAPQRKDQFVRVFDPCCSEGLAVARLAEQLRAQLDVPVQVWGSELHPERAAAAASRLDLALCAPFEALKWTPSHGLANVLFLNPPYDWSDDQQQRRVEDYFIQRGTEALVVGGLLIYIIPPAAFNREAYRNLMLSYDHLRVYRFPEPHFAAFKQLLIFGVRRDPKEYVDWYATHQESGKLFSGYGALSEAEIREKLPPLTPASAEEPWYKLPLIGSYQARLKRALWTADELEDTLTNQPPANPFQATTTCSIEVLMEPKLGHLSQLLSSGMLDTLVLPGEIIRGRSLPRMVEVVVEEKGNGKTETIMVTRWETTLMRLTRAGLEQYNGAEALPFLKEHAPRLGQVLRSRIQPYGTHSTPQERALLETLSKKRRRDDGKTGLYDDQKKSALGAVRALERHGIAHLICEMGYGKTTTAGAVIALRNAYPAFVMCPPHVLHKWVRELKDIIPGVKPVIVKHIRDLQAVATNHQPGEKLVVIAPTSLVKLGPGWKHAPAQRRNLRHINPTVRQALHERFRGAAATYETARQQLHPSGPLPAPGPWPREDADPRPTPQQREVARLRQAALAVANTHVVCPDCGQPLDGELWQAAQDRKQPFRCTCKVQPVDSYRTAPAAHEEEAEDETPVARPCGQPIFQYHSEVNRWPLDLYIQRQLRGFFKILVVDEVHEMKGDSERGESFGRLAQAIPNTLTLTGTFYGGVSSSLFLLLHRSQRDFRNEWQKHEVQRWIETYGRIQKTFTETESSSYYSAKKRVSVKVKEIPGIAPGVLRYLLHTTIFRSIKDLGIELPPLYDEVITLPMSPTQQADYERVETFTWELVKKYRNRYLSSWLQWTLARPNSAFRPEIVKGVEPYHANGDPCELLEVPAVVNGPELLPKEAWLLNKVKTELAEGRKVLIYVRQTATRDIQQRLLQIFADAGILAHQLPESLATDQREAWVLKNAPQVLVVNPKKVATGLDLVMYKTAIFYEIEYSLYTIWQACRRVWRQGQTDPVRLYYVVYENTMEAAALDLIAKKMTSAMLLYGDDVAGALVDDSVGEGSLALELLKIMEKGEALTRAKSIFGSDDNTTQSPVGSPTRVSPTLAAWVQITSYVQAQGLSLAQFTALSARQKAAVFSKAQQTLW